MSTFPCKFCVVIFSILSVSCSVTPNQVNQKKENTETISFCVFKITRKPEESKSYIELISKTQSQGELKKKMERSVKNTYLCIQVFHKNNLVDSIIIDHPLYKHFEYTGAGNKLIARDTILEQAEFFVRLALPSSPNELKIFEKTDTTLRKYLAIVKL